MPYAFRHHPDRRLIVAAIWGDFTIAEFREFRAARANAGIPPQLEYGIADLRRMRVAVDLEVLREYERTTGIDAVAAKRIALIFDEARSTAVGMMWTRMVEDRTDARVFSTLEAAYEWLGVEARDDDFDFDAV